MSKVALDRVTSSFGFQAAFNTVLQQIENEFSENVLYRKNPLGEPNSMSVDIDMGSHDLLNVGLVSATDFRINGKTLTQSLQDTLEEVAAYPAEAMGYRDEALAYRDRAQGFAINSQDSAIASQASADSSAISASEALASEQAAELAAANAAADILANIAPAQARGILLTGETTITLPWEYDNVNKNVSVFLDGVKQDADVALTYPSTTTIVLSEAVTGTTNWEVISLILTADSTLSGYVDQAQTIVNNAALSNLPVGSLIWVTGVNAPAGFIVGDGELRSRAAFPDLWAYAQASGNISVDDASWTFGQYSPGDGATTFRVPKVDDRFIRGKSATRPVGLVEEDVVGPLEYRVTNFTASTPLYIDGSRYAVMPTTGDGTEAVVTQSASGDTWITNTADETRPKALTMLPCIKAYDVISDPNVLNAVGVVNSIADIEARKVDEADLNAPGDAPMYVCRAWVNFDGTTTPPTIRASGNVSSVVRNATGDYTINFTTAMEDGNFAVTATGKEGSSDSFGLSFGISGDYIANQNNVRLVYVAGNASTHIDTPIANIAFFH